MSDIRFNRWLHQSGTGGVYQISSGRVGIGSSAPTEILDVVGNIAASGDITVVNASFSGDVSIGGTLTYDDVTNIDSVGIITARSGVHVTGGNVGIGTDDPSQKLSIGGVGGYLQSHGIGVYNPHSLGLRNGVIVYNNKSYNNSASYRAAALKAVGVSGFALGISTDANTNGLGGTLNAHIKFDGSAYFGGNVSLADGTGIDFSANSNLAGMTGEVLDHYETGTYVPTWTNVVSDPTTYRNGIDNGTTSNGLSYVRIGNQVTVTGAAFWNGTSINNTRPNMSLPFQARVYSVSGTISNYSLGVASEIHYLNYQSTTAINLFVMNSGGAHANFGDNSTGEMYFNITYMTY